MTYEYELEVLLRAARVAGEEALQFFRRPLEVRLKADLSPVTAADVASEKAFIAEISKAFPDDSIFGEESGMTRKGEERRWIVDPIDGTKAFTRGISTWSVLGALEDRGNVVAGVAHFPALGLTYSARLGGGCFRNDERIRSSETSDLESSLVQIAELGALMRGPRAAAITTIMQRAAATRSVGDALAGCLVLEGACDLWIEEGLQPYDVAPFYILAPEAGAAVSDWSGETSLTSGSIALGTPSVHRQSLDLLS
jgi:histidinol phosphatase-like enzyme (inositol monophosphatase family)